MAFRLNIEKKELESHTFKESSARLDYNTNIKKKLQKVLQDMTLEEHRDLLFAIMYNFPTLINNACLVLTII